MTRILIPTDFSDNAFKALQYAVYLFENETCEFYLLNAYHTDPSTVASWRSQRRNTRLFQSIKESSERELRYLHQKVEAENANPKHQFKMMAKADTLLNAIGAAVHELGIAFIFMGTQGATGLKSVFFGSNTVKVITKIDFCPIVAVPQNYDFDIPDSLLFATGFEHVYDKYELNPMIRLAKLWNSKIMVMHVPVEENLAQHQKTAKEVIAKRLHDVRHEHLEVKKERNITKAIKKAVSENEEIGMVAMIEYWHSFKERLTHEPVIKKVAFQIEVPFLVMHLPK